MEVTSKQDLSQTFGFFSPMLSRSVSFECLHRKAVMICFLFHIVRRMAAPQGSLARYVSDCLHNSADSPPGHHNSRMKYFIRAAQVPTVPTDKLGVTHRDASGQATCTLAT